MGSSDETKSAVSSSEERVNENVLLVVFNFEIKSVIY